MADFFYFMMLFPDFFYLIIKNLSHVNLRISGLIRAYILKHCIRFMIF